MSDDNNPWQRKSDGPPDLLKELKKMFSGKKGGAGGEPDGSGGVARGGGYWIWLVIGLIVIIWALSGIYIVNQAEEAVVLKFGKYVDTVGPGPHWLPSLVESETKVDIQQIRNFKYESEMLTRDENILIVPVNVQYRIDNARDYLFNVVNPEQSIQQATASALRASIGQMNLDEILTKGRAQLRDEINKQLVTTLKVYNPGLEVTDVRLLKIIPPEQVTAAFDDAINAREDEKSYIKMGQAYSIKVTSEVLGQVAKLKQAAEAYKTRTVLQAKGNVARYNAVLSPYLSAPQVTRERMYLDTVQDVLSHTHNVIVDSGAHNVLYLPLDRMLANLNIVKQQPPETQNTALSQQTTTPTTASASATSQQSSGYARPRTSYSTYTGGQS